MQQRNLLQTPHNELKFTNDWKEPKFDEATERLILAFITGLSLRYLIESNQINTDVATGTDLMMVREYSKASFDKIVPFLLGKGNAIKMSDQQLVMAEACKAHFPPLGEPLDPGFKRPTDMNNGNMLMHRISSTISNYVSKTWQGQNNVHKEEWSHVSVEFDMETATGPHRYKYPGFRVMIQCDKKAVSYTHHYLLTEANTPEEVAEYTAIMAAGYENIVTEVDSDDITTAERLMELFESTVIPRFREKLIGART